MLIKGLVVLFLIVQEIYNFTLNKIRDDYRKRSLPKEVSDIYDEKRYQDFLSYKSEYRQLSYKSEIVSVLLDLFIVFSPFFQWMDTGNLYLSLLLTITIINVVQLITSYFVEYYATFTIEEKYGMNKKTYKEFLKDFLLNGIFGYVMEVALYMVIVFICAHLKGWTNNFNITYFQSFLFVAAIIAVLGLLFLLFSYLSLAIMMKQYTFTDLEDEDLLNKIHSMMNGCKKKVKGIKVYNESKKSTTKNAFVLSVPFYRMIGIADNFMNENSKRELYGVLAHEIGHLKHKKNIFNYIKYSFFVLAALFLIWLIPNGVLVCKIAAYINQSFGLSYSCYYLYFLLFSLALEPLMYFVSLYNNYATRKEEYEADQNAVKEGYGQDLISLFKELSKDELVDVNPSPIIECIEYDHPGMYHRILGLQRIDNTPN